MKWNPHQDMENRAYAGILTSLFPEQTKTLPRIIAWSFAFLLDLILGVVGGFHVGLLEMESKLAAWILIAAIVGVFWLQGKIWYAAADYFRRRQELD